MNTSVLQKKTSVDFPGINAPIPEHADEGRWATSQGPRRNGANLQSNCFSEPTPKGLSQYHRGRRDYRDGGSPGYSPTMFDSSHGYSGFIHSQPSRSSGLRYDHPSSYSGYASDPFSPRGDLPLMRDPSLGESVMYDRRRSSLFREGSIIHGIDALSPYASSGLLQSQSPHHYGPIRFEDPAYKGYWRPY